MRALARLAIPIAAMAASVATAAAPAGAADAKAVVDAIYRAIPRASPAHVHYTPELQALLDRDTKEAGGEVGLIDGDPFCDCQDTVPGYAFRSRAVSAGPGRAVVAVDLANGRRSRFRIDLRRVGGRWAVADIAGPDRPSLLRYLRDNLRPARGK